MSRTDKISFLIELTSHGREKYIFKRIIKKCFRIKEQCVLWRKIKQKEKYAMLEWRKLGEFIILSIVVRKGHTEKLVIKDLKGMRKTAT